MKKIDDEKIVFSTAQQTLIIYSAVDNLHSQDLHRVKYKNLKKKYGQNHHITPKDYERAKTARNFIDAKKMVGNIYYLSDIIRY